MPLTRALEARFMASHTEDTVTTLAEGRLHDLLATVRLRAPFETLVLAHLHVFLNRVVRLRDLLRAKPLNLFLCEHLLALVLHARQL